MILHYEVRRPASYEVQVIQVSPTIVSPPVTLIFPYHPVSGQPSPPQADYPAERSQH